MLPELSGHEKSSLLEFAKITLNGLYHSHPEKILNQFASEGLTPSLREHYPCFVTLTTSPGRLRGCVGSLVAHEPLYKNVFTYARAAGLKDPRFRPVEPQEIPDLKTHLSVLGSMEPIETLEEVKIGLHGLYVRYGQRHGVLLADVATERQWTPEQFLKQTCVKAGLTPEDLANYEVFRFAQVGFGDD